MKNTVVFDLDGTLADGSHRIHLLPKKEDIPPIDDIRHNRVWDAFNLACGDDRPISDNIQLLRSLSRSFRIVILTGRDEIARPQTEQWLKKHGAVPSFLIMRGSNDSRPDTEYKEEQLRSWGLGQIICCFDDIPRIAHHIRSLGVTCHLVTHYEKPGLHEE